jgi:hypothetical protein
VRALAINPTTPNLLYAGTANYYGQAGGLLKSADGGQSWTLVWSNAQVNAVAVDPASAQIIYAGAEAGGVVKSTDGGTTWLPMGTALNNLPISALLVDSVNHQIYATTKGAGFYLSSDGGSTWTAMNSGLSDLNCLCLTSHTPSRTLYLGTYSGYVFAGVPPAVSPPPPSITAIHMYSGLTITGTVSSACAVQASPDLSNWSTISSFNLPFSPYLFIDTNSPAYPHRSYRVILGQ